MCDVRVQAGGFREKEKVLEVTKKNTYCQLRPVL